MLRSLAVHATCFGASVFLALSPARAGEPVPRLASPLRGCGDAVPGAVRTLAVDLGAYERLHSIRRADLADFPFPGGSAADLEVEQFDVLAPHAGLVVVTEEGESRLPRPDLVLLRGMIAGDADSHVFLALTPTDANGLIETGDGVTYAVSSGRHTDGLAPVIYDIDALPAFAPDPAIPPCGSDALPRVSTPHLRAPGGVRGPDSPPCRTVNLAVDSDSEFTANLFGGDPTASAAYAMTLIAADSEIYTRDFNTRLAISYLRVFATPDDPWSTDDAGTLLDQFRNHWRTKMRAVDRDVAHLLSAKGLSGAGGVAYLGVLCSRSWGYGLSGYLGGSFPYPLKDYRYANWDPDVTAHEIGHNFNAPHTHDTNPPIDSCGLGDCSHPKGGTIMSYCQTCSGGMSNIRLWMHDRIINEYILPYLDASSCGFTGRGPAFTDEPDGGTFCEGSTVTLAAAAPGAETFQWRRNGMDIPGATGPSLTLDPISRGDAGTYDVIAANACGATESAPADVRVTPTCPADFDASCSLTINDFIAMQAAFRAGDARADFNHDGKFTVNDFIAFQAAFRKGCG